jgi:hypothetical protein
MVSLLAVQSDGYEVIPIYNGALFRPLRIGETIYGFLKFSPCWTQSINQIFLGKWRRI